MRVSRALAVAVRVEVAELAAAKFAVVWVRAVLRSARVGSAQRFVVASEAVAGLRARQTVPFGVVACSRFSSPAVVGGRVVAFGLLVLSSADVAVAFAAVVLGRIATAVILVRVAVRQG